MAPTYYFDFAFFRIDPKWRWMADLAKEESAKEVENVLSNSGITYRSYSTLGIRDDADILLWFCSEDIAQIQDAVSRVYLTVFGKYIVPSRAYLSCTRPSLYARSNVVPSIITGAEARRYVIVYPFTKTREWYLLDEAARRGMMDEHIGVGQKYPSVTLNTTYSFGIHDQDFMLAFECDDLQDFQNLIMDLRQTQVSRYVQRDTPMMVGVKKDIIPLITSLG